MSALDYVLKATPAKWWGKHKQSISKWPQCRRLMEIIFGEEISFHDKKIQDWQILGSILSTVTGIGNNICNKNEFIDSSTLWKWYQEVGTHQ